MPTADDSQIEDSQLDAIIAEYLQANEAGAAPSREALRSRHPNLADELDAFLENNERLGRVFRRLDLSVVSTVSDVAADLKRTIDPEIRGLAVNLEVASSSSSAGSWGDYELIKELASGGMGVVYKAWHRRLQRHVALKMMLGGEYATELAIRRFRTEAAAAAQLDHPHIVPVYDFGAHQGHHYLTMGLVEGGSLADRLRNGPLPPVEAAQCLRKIALALEYAHQRGVIHRDIKPANVLVDSAGEPRITDFGLAKWLDAKGSQDTRSGEVLGTASYMAPEQASGKVHDVGPLADVFSLGSLLYTLLVGRPPFVGDGVLQTLQLVMEAEPEFPRRLNPQIPKPLEIICLKCLEKSPGNRYESAKKLANDLGRFLEGEPIHARPPGPIGQISRWARQKPSLAVTCAGLTVFFINYFILVLLGVSGTDGPFHVFVTMVVLCWGVGAAMLHRISQEGTSWQSAVVPYAWSAMEVGLFSLYLLVSDGPKSALVVCYLALISATALRGQVRLVWFATGLSIIAYIVVAVETFLRRPELSVTFAASELFVVTQLVVGFVQSLLLRRIRQES